MSRDFTAPNLSGVLKVITQHELNSQLLDKIDRDNTAQTELIEVWKSAKGFKKMVLFFKVVKGEWNFHRAMSLYEKQVEETK